MTSSKMINKAYKLYYWNILFLLLFVLLSPTVNGNPAHPIQAFPVFNDEEIAYHKYAAAIAASEPLKKLRDQELKTVVNAFTVFLEKIKGNDDFASIIMSALFYIQVTLSLELVLLLKF